MWINSGRIFSILDLIVSVLHQSLRMWLCVFMKLCVCVWFWLLMQCQKSSGWGWAATPWPPSEIWSEALSGRPPPTPCLPPWSTQTGFSDSTAAANKGSRRLIQLSSWREVLERGRKVKGLAVTQLVALPSLNDWYYTQTETGNSLQLHKCEIEATE